MMLTEPLLPPPPLHPPTPQSPKGGDEEDDGGMDVFAAARRRVEERMAERRTRVDYFPLQVGGCAGLRCVAGVCVHNCTCPNMPCVPPAQMGAL